MFRGAVASPKPMSARISEQLTPCPTCERPNPASRTRCWGCGAELPQYNSVLAGSGNLPGSSGESGAARSLGFPPPPPWAAAAPASPAPDPRARGRSETETGLFLMVIGLAIGWIPLVSIVGGLLLFIGFVYVWNGRYDYRPPHPRFVLWALLLAISGYVVALGLELVLFATGRTPSSLVTFPLTTSVGTSISLLGAVLLVYSIATPGARQLLWVAYGLGVATSVITGVAQAFIVGIVTAGFPLAPNFASFTGLDLIILFAPALPYLTFFFAYRRVRRELGMRAGTPASPSILSPA